MKLSKYLTFSDATVQKTAMPTTVHQLEFFGLLPLVTTAGLSGGPGAYWLGQICYGLDGGTNGGSSTWQLDGHYVGTYSLNILYCKLGDTGIVKHEFSVDGGSTWTTLASGLDTYTSTVTPSVASYTGLVIPEGSIVQFRITVTSKNASSTAYYWALSGWELLRTGP